MEKSRSDWHGRVPAERFCAGCGEKLVLNVPGGLWLREFPVREVLHFACQKASERGEAAREQKARGR